MRLLVGDYIRQSAAVHGIRKIDFWLDDPQYERRAGIFALIDIIPQNHGFADSAAQTPIAYGGIKEKRGGSGEPDRRHDRDPYLQRIGARARRGRKRMVNDRVDDLIEGGNARLNGRRRLHHNARADCFRARYKTQRTLNGKREDQPDGDNAPEQNIHPFWRFFQAEPQYQNRDHDPACGYAPVDDLQKQLAHDLSPFRIRSIICCTSSSSSSERS